MLTAAIDGFLLGASLIIAIGAQNAFVLRQGLKREFVFAVCLICAASDALLIAVGVAGLGTLVSLSPLLVRAVTVAGAAFLFLYGLRAFVRRRVRRPCSPRPDRGRACRQLSSPAWPSRS
jgi:L-lysine exporter family protein LysE/ArgO